MNSLKSYMVIKTAIILIGLMYVMGASANDLRVPLDYPSIQSAIDNATDGDAVLVAPGHYVENIKFHGKAITVLGEGGPEVTTLDGGNAGSVVIFDLYEGANSVLSGFTIRNGYASFGAGVQLFFSSPTITDNIFDSNTQTSGGAGAGIVVNGASPMIERNIFRNNSCDTQHLSGVLSVFNVSSPRIANNIFENNPCRAINLNLPAWTSPEIINNTVVGNTVGVMIDLREASESIIFANNIIVGNGIGLKDDSGSDIYDPTWVYNLVFDNLINYEMIADQTGINGNISVDPLFVDQQNGDYYLSIGSPAIDSGLNANELLSATDVIGNDRIVDGDGDGLAIVDMGAYEVQHAIMTIEIDIKPNSQTNNINPRSSGVIAAAVLTSKDFDALQVDTDTVQFGPAGAAKRHSQAHVEDVDYDGDMDLLFHFLTPETNIQCGDTEAILSGKTWSGTAVSGTDSVNPVGCR